MSTNPNLVVVICHDLGQHLGCYGVGDVRSPNVDAFAASGIRFENIFCAAPQCSPSRGALWTGRYPHANGLVGLAHAGFANELNPDERHLAQILGDAGYETRLFGIQHESKDPARLGYQHVHKGWRCGELATEFETFLSERRSADTPLFAQIGLFEPHRPFPHEDVEPLPKDQLTVPAYMPDIPEVREDLANLEASTASADRAFGRILRAIRRSAIADNAIILFTADHGIAFTHAKMTLYDPGLEVPLILSVPGIEGGRTFDEMVSHVDVMPTLLDLAGLPKADNLHGRSFASLLRGEPYEPNEAVFGEKTYHTYYDPMRAIRTDRWKLIANFECAPWQELPPDFDCNAKGYVETARALRRSCSQMYHPPLELYDLQADPCERANLADAPEHRQVRDDLVCALRQWMQDTGDPLLDGPMAQGAYRERMQAFKATASDERKD